MHIKPTIFRKEKFIYDSFHAPSKKSSNCYKFYEAIEIWIFAKKFICNDTEYIVGPVSVLCEWDGVENVFSAIHIIIGVLTVQPTDDASELANWINLAWTVENGCIFFTLRDEDMKWTCSVKLTTRPRITIAPKRNEQTNCWKTI